jgi:hypothetical protein
MNKGPNARRVVEGDGELVRGAGLDEHLWCAAQPSSAEGPLVTGVSLTPSCTKVAAAHLRCNGLAAAAPVAA